MVDPTGHWPSFLQPRGHKERVLTDTGTNNPSPTVTPEPEPTPGPTPTSGPPSGAIPGPTPGPTPVLGKEPTSDPTNNNETTNYSMMGVGAIGLIGLASFDGVLPFGDVLALGLLAWYSLKAESNAMQRINEKVEKKRNDNKPIFTVNPYDFHPNNLVPTLRGPTKNGILISWMDPVTNTEIFRWDANTNYDNGPHYHINGLGDIHFYAPCEVPEPWASIYFGGE